MTAVIIGRFQVPYLHLGHIYLLSTALRQADRVIILLGTSRKIDQRNPYTVLSRIDMIARIFPQIGISVLWDHPDNDLKWSQEVDFHLRDYPDAVLWHSRDSFKDHYHGHIKTYEFPELPGYSGTKLRGELGNRGYDN